MAHCSEAFKGSIIDASSNVPVSLPVIAGQPGKAVEVRPQADGFSDKLSVSLSWENWFSGHRVVIPD